MRNLRSHPQILPTKSAPVAAETNHLTDAESHATQFATNFARLFTATIITMCRLPPVKNISTLSVFLIICNSMIFCTVTLSCTVTV